EVDVDVAPAHAAAPAGADGLAGRFLARDRERERPAALGLLRREARGLGRVHEARHQAVPPALPGGPHARQLDEVDAQADDQDPLPAPRDDTTRLAVEPGRGTAGPLRAVSLRPPPPGHRISPESQWKPSANIRSTRSSATGAWARSMRRWTPSSSARSRSRP